MQVYYAHSKKIYGTLRERRERILLASIFPKKSIVCPNRDMGELGSMLPYLNKVQNSDIVVVSEFKNHIGKGAYEEVVLALQEYTPVFVLRRKKLILVKDIKVVNWNDWQVTYGKVITI